MNDANDMTKTIHVSNGRLVDTDGNPLSRLRPVFAFGCDYEVTLSLAAPLPPDVTRIVAMLDTDFDFAGKSEVCALAEFSPDSLTFSMATRTRRFAEVISGRSSSVGYLQIDAIHEDGTNTRVLLDRVILNGVVADSSESFAVASVRGLEISERGTWVIDGVDTGQPARGVPGVSPSAKVSVDDKGNVILTVTDASGTTSAVVFGNLIQDIDNVLSTAPEFQFSHDGEGWHSAQEDGDIYLRFRNPAAKSPEWTDKVKFLPADVNAMVTSAQNAQTAAEAARDDAMSAKADAETAKADAEAARSYVESARDAAVSAKADAEAAMGEAESARDAAVSAKTAAEAARDAMAPMVGTTAPTADTVGFVGQLYVDTATGKTYHCTARTNTGTDEEPSWSCTWEDDINAKGGMIGGDWQVNQPGITLLPSGKIKAFDYQGFYEIGDSRIQVSRSGILRAYLSDVGIYSRGYYQQGISVIPATTTACTLSEGVYSHIPDSAPTYTLPAVADTGRTHEIVLNVRFGGAALSYSFEDASSNAIAPLSTPAVEDGTVISFLCRHEPLLEQWAIMPVSLGRLEVTA